MARLIKCDRCGKIINSAYTDNGSYEVAINRRGCDSKFIIDLCPECGEKLKSWISDNDFDQTFERYYL